ncbi:MAG: PLP-dependent aminotransferase family protein [Deltaproteobacteria bacterium]|jgi:DNA-binding transcriptional MocR family regulator|nr:PLP-dependent aminotransferase family protein [Deltaproteobacteria bacterium]
MWTLDYEALPGAMPVYRRIIRHVEDAVASGRLAPGERLPAERTLARLLGVNRSTIIRALEDLGDRGILLRRRGSGTYVNKEKWGVQSYARLNWQTPPALLPAGKAGPFHREAAVLREEAARTGRTLYDLSRDDLAPELLPAISFPEASWDALVRAERGGEASHLGLPAFRRAVARFLRETVGFSVPLEDILITSGSRQAIFLITQCLLRAGDAVGVEAPSYCYSLPVFQAAGLRLCALPMDEEGITLEGLEQAASRRSLKMVFLNPVFQNPTGRAMPAARKKAVLAFCAAARIPIVEDDAYSLLAFDAGASGASRNNGNGGTGGRDVTPLKAWDAGSQVMYAGSLSSYAGRNIRAGWLVAPPGVIGRLAGARHMMDAGLSVLPQVLAGEYLERVAASHLPRLRAELARRAEALGRFLRDRFGESLAFSLPAGGLYVYAVARDSGRKDYAELQRALLRCGLIPALGEDFGDARPSFRLNCSFFSG